MDWTTVAAKVVSLGAPMLGSALGGPLGDIAGKVLADAFGAAAATPEAVHAAISDKAADLKLAAEAAQKAESELRNRPPNSPAGDDSRLRATLVAAQIEAERQRTVKKDDYDALEQRYQVGAAAPGLSARSAKEET